MTAGWHVWRVALIGHAVLVVIVAGLQYATNQLGLLPLIALMFLGQPWEQIPRMLLIVPPDDPEIFALMVTTPAVLNVVIHGLIWRVCRPRLSRSEVRVGTGGQDTPPRHTRRYWYAAAALCVVGVLVAAAIAWATVFRLSGTQVDRVVLADGEYELVVEHWTTMIDHAYDVKIRRSGGFFPREELVWRSLADYGPPNARFTGQSQIEITTNEGVGQPPEVYRSSFEPETLEVSPVHCLMIEDYC